MKLLSKAKTVKLKSLPRSNMGKMNVVKFNRLTKILEKYAESRSIELMKYNQDLHLRLTDGFTCLDVWPSTGKYYVKDTSYHEQLEGTGLSLVEKAGQKGYISSYDDKAIEFLDGLFYATELMEANDG